MMRQKKKQQFSHPQGGALQCGGTYGETEPEQPHQAWVRETLFSEACRAKSSISSSIWTKEILFLLEIAHQIEFITFGNGLNKAPFWILHTTFASVELVPLFYCAWSPNISGFQWFSTSMLSIWEKSAFLIWGSLHRLSLCVFMSLCLSLSLVSLALQLF